MLAAEDLVAGGRLDFTVEIPPHVRNPRDGNVDGTAAAAARAVLARLTDPAAGLATALERAIVLTTLAPGASLFEASPFGALPELADGGADAASGGSRRLGRRVAGAPAPPRARRQPV